MYGTCGQTKAYADERRGVDKVQNALLGVQLHTHFAQRPEFGELLVIERRLVARELLVCMRNEK